VALGGAARSSARTRGEPWLIGADAEQRAATAIVEPGVAMATGASACLPNALAIILITAESLLSNR
jgi:hypothetical protein